MGTICTGIPHVDNDPTTGQANMLRASSGTACLYIDDGIDNPVALLTDYKAAAFVYSFDPYGLPTLNQTTGGNGVPQNPYWGDLRIPEGLWI